jgi:hypothetical protein
MITNHWITLEFRRYWLHYQFFPKNKLMIILLILQIISDNNFIRNLHQLLSNFLSFCEIWIFGKIENLSPLSFGSNMCDSFQSYRRSHNSCFAFKSLFSSDLLILATIIFLHLSILPMNFQLAKDHAKKSYLVSFFVNGCELGATKNQPNG